MHADNAFVNTVHLHIMSGFLAGLIELKKKKKLIISKEDFFPMPLYNVHTIELYEFEQLHSVTGI